MVRCLRSLRSTSQTLLKEGFKSPLGDLGVKKQNAEQGKTPHSAFLKSVFYVSDAFDASLLSMNIYVLGSIKTRSEEKIPRSSFLWL